MSVRELLAEKRAASDFSSIYLLLVFAIAATLMVFLIKPMFRESQTLTKNAPGTSGASGGS